MIPIRTITRTFPQCCSYSINHSKAPFSLNHLLSSRFHFKQFSTFGVLNTNSILALEKANAATHVSEEEAGEFCVVPLPGRTFGAEVFGLRGLGHASRLKVQLKKLINQHQFLVFRELSARLRPLEHVSFALLFGNVTEELSKPPAYLKEGVHLSAIEKNEDDKASNLAQSVLDAHEKSPFPPAIFRVVKEPEDDVAFGEGWHTDLTFRSDPPKYATLAGRVLPPNSGDTLFADMSFLYDDLDEHVKASIDGKTALHTDRAGRETNHPIVRIHPDTGKKILFVNNHFTQWQDDPLLESLVAKVQAAEDTNAPCFYRHKWEEGDLIMWDEISTQHNADGGSYKGHYRECHRVLVTDTEPVLPELSS